MLSYIQKKYDFTDYQMKQLEYAFKVIASEISKMVIICAVMFRDLKLCLFVFFMMTMLRICTGGLHCDTYVGCLFTSFLFVLLSVKLAQTMYIDDFYKVVSLIICAILSYILTPVISKVHQKLSRELVKRSRMQIFTTIIIYIPIIMLFSPNIYIQTGYMVIVLNTLQLIIGKILMKGVSVYDEE